MLAEVRKIVGGVSHVGSEQLRHATPGTRLTRPTLGVHSRLRSSAGLTVLALTSIVLGACSFTATNAESGSAQFLWVVSGTGGTTSPADATGTARLTLVQVNDLVVEFADRPLRSAGTVPVGSFVESWADIFEDDPPNAVLSYVIPGDNRPRQAAFELRDPAYDELAQTLTWRAQRIDEDPTQEASGPSTSTGELLRLPESFVSASLFIDSSAGTVALLGDSTGSTPDPSPSVGDQPGGSSPTPASSRATPTSGGEPVFETPALSPSGSTAEVSSSTGPSIPDPLPSRSASTSSPTPTATHGLLSSQTPPLQQQTRRLTPNVNVVTSYFRPTQSATVAFHGGWGPILWAGSVSVNGPAVKVQSAESEGTSVSGTLNFVANPAIGLPPQMLFVGSITTNGRGVPFNGAIATFEP